MLITLITVTKIYLRYKVDVLNMLLYVKGSFWGSCSVVLVSYLDADIEKASNSSQRFFEKADIPLRVVIIYDLKNLFLEDNFSVVKM